MKKVLPSLVLLISLSGFSQTPISEDQMQFKMDSIQKEANLLFGLENAAWKGTDYVTDLPNIKNAMGGYITYHEKDAFVCSILSKDYSKTLVRYYFDEKTGKLSKVNDKVKNISTTEKLLYEAKKELINQISNEDYGIVVPDDFNLNFIPIKWDKGFKIYIITSSSDAYTIPFGNDYLFYLDSSYKITAHERFHKSFVPSKTKHEGRNIVRCMHNHVLEYPYISATDICNFKLYAPFGKIDEFSVISGSLEGIFTYKLSTDKLRFEPMD